MGEENQQEGNIQLYAALAKLGAFDRVPEEGKIPVSFETMRSWYDDARWEKVYSELTLHVQERVSKIWPNIGGERGAVLAQSILSDIVDEDPQSAALFCTMEAVGLDVSGPDDLEKISNIQLAAGRVLISGHIQTPWERGEEIDWEWWNGLDV